MSHHAKSGPITFLFDNSLFLIAGAFGALVWANVDKQSYEHFVHLDILGSDHAEEGDHTGDTDSGKTAKSGDGHDHKTGDAETDAKSADGDAAKKDDHGGLTLHFLVNDILMALFFAIAGKEVWEALLPGGALSDPRKAATPLLATVGGIVGPAGIYAVGCLATGTSDLLMDGWAIPCATDIAFSYLVARLIFGAGHPAIAFLLLLAIADDAAGLIILAVFYPSGTPAPEWLLLSAGGCGLGLIFRKMRMHSFWWYLLIPGIMSWYAFYKAGIHPALGLVPIIPVMPHAATDLGIFARQEMNRDDTLNEFEHWWKNPVEIILGLFGLMNAGVGFSSVGTGTWLVLVGLLVGKPLGIVLFTALAEKGFGLKVPEGMNYRHILTLGTIAGIGFTVALFVSDAAFGKGKAPQEVLDSAKMGALGSFGAVFLSFIVARALGVKPMSAEEVANANAPKSEDH